MPTVSELFSLIHTQFPKYGTLVYSKEAITKPHEYLTLHYAFVGLDSRTKHLYCCLVLSILTHDFLRTKLQHINARNILQNTKNNTLNAHMRVSSWQQTETQGFITL